MAGDAVPPFSTLSPSILEREGRLQIGRQILAVLEHQLQSTGLGQRRVLDIGCSSGIITARLAEVSGAVVGIDVDESALVIARRDHPQTNLDFRRMSGSAIDFPPGAFDIVICNQVYYWLDDPARLMAEIHRVLAPGGLCFFAAANKYTLWEAQYRLPLLSVLPPRLADVYVRAAGKGDRFGCRYLSYWQLRRLCSGFTVHHYTPRVLKNPGEFGFTRLVAVGRVTRRLPLSWLDAIEPLSPNLIWVLEKRG